MNILITGTTRGIGRELAKQLSALGHFIIGVNRETTSGVCHEEHLVDLLNPNEIQELYLHDNKEIDILINNAGVYGHEDFLLDSDDIDPEMMVDVYKVNVVAPYMLTKQLLINLPEDALVINISSTMGSISSVKKGGSYAYRCSKAALNMLTKNMHLELNKLGITVCAIHPGWVKTEMGGENADLDVSDAATNIINLIYDLEPTDSGLFIDSRDGKCIDL